MKLYRNIIWIIVLILILQSCKKPQLKLFDLQETKIDEIPSGSGITILNDNYYVIGDDSPFLFTLTSELEIIDKLLLVDSVNLLDGRILKSEKPDLEALEIINDKELIIFGSGSKSPQRDVFYRIVVGNNCIIEQYDISEFYSSIKELPIMQNSELNIEGVAYYEEDIFLFNRQNNLILKYNYKELLNYFKLGKSAPIPEIKQCKLPNINNIEAGFSGAVALKNEPLIIFTASVENTNNAYDDGEILGSFIGIIDISDKDISNVIDFCEISSSNKKLKVESVSVENENSDRVTDIVLITDDDKGNSIILKGKLTW
jgi:hypothetical protein